MLKHLHKLCEDNGVTLKELARIANVDLYIFQLYESGELKMDDDTVNRITEWSGCDWLWLEYGYEPEQIQIIDDYERLGMEFKC